MEKHTKPTTVKQAPTRAYMIKGWLVMGATAILVLAMVGFAAAGIDWRLEPGWAFKAVLFGVGALLCYLVAGPDKL